VPSPIQGSEAGVCCTLVTRNHLPYARVLMASVQEHWPAAQRYVLIVDADDNAIRELHEPFEVLAGIGLRQTGFAKRAFLNGPGGFCVMFKPLLVSELLRRTGTPFVVFTDADTRFYSKPTALIEAVHRSPIAFTPHTFSLMPTGHLRSNGDMARAGTYNAGLFVARNDPRAFECLRTWDEGMWRDAWQDHRFAWDQIWLPLLRYYFPESEIISDPSCNVAYWNLWERPLRETADGRYFVGEAPLTHFHFSFFNPETPNLIANKWGQVVESDNPAVHTLCRNYASELRAANTDNTLRQPYRFGFFSDGQPVSELHREYYRTRIVPIGQETDDPFDPSYTVAGFTGVRRLHAYFSLGARLRRMLDRLQARFRRLVGR
jgi:hypothetical protein